MLAAGGLGSATGSTGNLTAGWNCAFDRSRMSWGEMLLGEQAESLATSDRVATPCRESRDADLVVGLRWSLPN